jgi:hypothetical protein
MLSVSSVGPGFSLRLEIREIKILISTELEPDLVFVDVADNQTWTPREYCREAVTVSLFS